jgi:hypothetical protein
MAEGGKSTSASALTFGFARIRFVSMKESAGLIIKA